MNLLWNIRYRLIRLLVGKAAVAFNLTFDDRGIAARPGRCVVAGCTFLSGLRLHQSSGERGPDA